MGPLINQRRVDAIERVVEDARSRGGVIAAGGGRPAGQNKGFFFQPTVLTGLPDDALALAEENFGPVAAITPFREADEVYDRANAANMAWPPMSSPAIPSGSARPCRGSRPAWSA